MTADQIAVLSRVARQVARIYHRSHPWLSEGELSSEAWASMLEALPKFDSAKGDLGGYLFRCASRACKRLCWHLGVAANVPERSASPQLIGQVRAATDREEVLAILPAGEAGADEALDAARNREALAQIVAEYLAAGQEGEAVRAVLYGEAKSSEAAERFNVPVKAVYKEAYRVRQALAADPRVQEML